jgi:hypothetical protein
MSRLTSLLGEVAFWLIRAAVLWIMGFFSMGDGVLHSRGGLKRIGKGGNHGLEHLLTEEI